MSSSLSMSSAKQVDNEYVAAVTDLEKSVAKVWKEVLDLEQVSVDANFFAIGGHSLAAMRIIERLEKDMEITVSPLQLFDNPTVRQFCLSLKG